MMKGDYLVLKKVSCLLTASSASSSSLKPWVQTRCHHFIFKLKLSCFQAFKLLIPKLSSSQALMSSSGWTPPHLTHTARGGRTGTAANSAFGTWKEKVKDIPAELSPCIHCLHGYIINFTAKSIFTSYVSHSSKSSMAIRGHKNE